MGTGEVTDEGIPHIADIKNFQILLTILPIEITNVLG